MVVVIIRYAWIVCDVSTNGPPKRAIEEFSATQKDDT